MGTIVWLSFRKFVEIVKVKKNLRYKTVDIKLISSLLRNSVGEVVPHVEINL